MIVYGINVGKYTSPMDSLGNGTPKSVEVWNPKSSWRSVRNGEKPRPNVWYPPQKKGRLSDLGIGSTFVPLLWLLGEFDHRMGVTAFPETKMVGYPLQTMVLAGDFRLISVPGTTASRGSENYLSIWTKSKGCSPKMIGISSRSWFSGSMFWTSGGCNTVAGYGNTDIRISKLLLKFAKEIHSQQLHFYPFQINRVCYFSRLV